MNEKKKKEKWGSRVKTQKGQSRAKEVFETYFRGCQKLKCSIQGILEFFENLQTLLKLGQIFEDTLVGKNENPRTKICS